MDRDAEHAQRVPGRRLARSARVLPWAIAFAIAAGCGGARSLGVFDADAPFRGATLVCRGRVEAGGRPMAYAAFASTDSARRVLRRLPDERREEDDDGTVMIRPEQGVDVFVFASDPALRADLCPGAVSATADERTLVVVYEALEAPTSPPARPPPDDDWEEPAPGAPVSGSPDGPR